MVELSHRDRTIRVKIVYYGPPYSGKTTNLQVLHRAALEQRRGEMISVNSAQDRTILFDLLPLRARGFRGFDLRVQLVAVPGQPTYAATRRVVLKGVDSLVFVASSAVDRWDENVQSLREMTQNLLSHHLDPATLPLVFQYNKRDLPQVVEIDALDRSLNSRHTKAIPAVAVNGQGVLETFTAVLEKTVEDLSSRYAILDVRGAAPIAAWVEETVQQLFGSRQIAEPREGGPPAPPSASGRHTPSLAATVVRVPPPTPPPEAATPAADARTAKAELLVETYAEASAQVGEALAEVREERDSLRGQLEDLRKAYQGAEAILDGTPLQQAIAPVLDSMAVLAGVEQAAFWLMQPEAGLPRAVALRGLEVDPLLGDPAAAAEILERLTQEPPPGVSEGEPDGALAAALAADGRFLATLAVPFRTPGGMQAVGVFYYGFDTARPGAQALARLHEIPRVISSALELAATLRTVKSAEKALELALAGTASQHGLEHVAHSLERLRDRLGEIRSRADAPSWFAEQYVELAPALVSALDGVRSLLAFGAGELRRESVVVAELLEELRGPEVMADADPALDTVSADGTLLRLALRALADEVRSRAGGNSAPLRIRALRGPRSLQVALSGPSPGAATAAPASPLNAGLSLAVARRIAELHGGSLVDRRPPPVDPAPGERGANEIVLTLPLS